MSDIGNFVLNTMPAGAIVFGPKMKILFTNKRAESFFRRHRPPEEISVLSGRIFDAISAGKVKEQFPGEIYLYKKLEGSSSNWVFRFHIHENPEPYVAIFIVEETLSNRTNMNELRLKYRLTRRETDIVRRVLDGLKNVEIAEDLEISEQTVKDHLSNVYEKLSVKNRFELACALMGPSQAEASDLSP